MQAGLWTEVTPSGFAHERAGLDFIRQRLPDREPYRAWSNFSFIDGHGGLNEADLLVVTPNKVYLVELKSYSGKLEGDAGTWVLTVPDGRRRTIDNPLWLADKKAKRLKSLLMAQPALRNTRLRTPYVEAAVFLHAAKLQVALRADGRTGVYGPDRDESRPNVLPGMVAELTHIDQRRGAAIDRRLSRAITQAMGQAGIRESVAHRRVGPYELRELLADGEGWQDYSAPHPHVPGVQRRIRLYPLGRARSEQERQSLVRAARREVALLQGIDHPAIESPHELIGTPRGPALVYDLDPGAQRLDHWIADHADRLDLTCV